RIQQAVRVRRDLLRGYGQAQNQQEQGDDNGAGSRHGVASTGYGSGNSLYCKRILRGIGLSSGFVHTFLIRDFLVSLTLRIAYSHKRLMATKQVFSLLPWWEKGRG